MSLTGGLTAAEATKGKEQGKEQGKGVLGSVVIHSNSATHLLALART